VITSSRAPVTALMAASCLLASLRGGRIDCTWAGATSHTASKCGVNKPLTERQYDAAIAALAQGHRTDDHLLEGDVLIKSMTEPQLGMHVVKCGAASGLTHALVDAVHGSYQVPYDGLGDSRYWMLGIRLVYDGDFPDHDISVPGDSGSIWVTASGQAAALNFAGEDDLGPLNEYALAHPISNICNLLEIDIV
jgi:hypothetical protein